jgi:TonB-linked SusC/RagA family outer membrane protein
MKKEKIFQNKKGGTWLKKLSMLCFLACFSLTVSAQKRVSGTVLDASGETVIGANVVEKGTTNGTSTDSDGKFALTVGDNAVLQISYIGYVTQEIKVGSQTNLSVTLAEESQTLEEVVVVGYGSVRKKDLTGAVSSVRFEDTPMPTFSSAAQALAGKAAGLQVATISAQPGGQTNLNIRGATSTGAGNDPLIVIDGFPVSSSSEPGSGNRYNGGPKDNTLATLNPNDIESIAILKDASATAIYGARAGHGVILVTTKRGKEGKVKIDYAGNVASQSIAKRVETMNASQWMTEYNRYQRDTYLYDNKMGVYSKGGTANPVDWSGYKGDRFSASDIANPKYDTDWLDAVTRTGFQQQHSITMSGGSEKSKYLASVSFFDQAGIIKNSDMQRFNARFNLDQQISRIFKAGFSLNANENSFTNTQIGGSENEYGGILISAIRANPTFPIRDEEGNYTINPNAVFLPNAVSLLEISDLSRLDRLLANSYIEASPIQDLKLKMSLGVDRNFNKRKTYLPKTTLYGQKTNGQAYISTNERSDYLLELTADYNKTIEKHSLNALAGYSFQDFNWEGVEAGNQDFLIDGFLYNNLGAGAYAKPTVSSWAGKSQMASFFGRINYNYDYKYYLTATLRADGASNLAEGHQWGYFPSVAVAWNINSESFFEPLKETITLLKLRASYGETGNSNIGNRARDLYSVGMNYLFGSAESKGVYLGQMGNKNLKWETTSEFNVGLDFELFSRFKITAEYYDRIISDLLSSRSLMSYMEVSSIAANIGKTQSKGFELTINSQNIKEPNFSWTTDLTFSFYRDRWKERAPTWKPAVYQNVNDYIRSQFGYKSDGLVKPEETGNLAYQPGAVAGMVKLVDLDGFQRDADGNVVYDANGRAQKTGQPDGRLDDADIVFYGTSDPGYLYGFNNTLVYKNFDLNIYIYGVLDQLRSFDHRTTANSGDIVRQEYGGPTVIQQEWSSDKQDNKYYGVFQVYSAYGAGDFTLQKTWYARVRNITLGYTVPLKPNNIIQGARIYADINNPFTFTNYKGLDPETDAWSGWMYSYPNVKTYSLGINLSF